MRKILINSYNYGIMLELSIINIITIGLNKLRFDLKYSENLRKEGLYEVLENERV